MCELLSKESSIALVQVDCVKSVCIRSFSSPYFPAFGLNTERYSRPQAFLQISQNSQEYACVKQSLVFNIVAGLRQALSQVFSCEFCEICNNTLFYRTSPVAASDCIHSEKLKITVVSRRHLSWICYSFYKFK